MSYFINAGLLMSAIVFIANGIIYIINNWRVPEVERKTMSNFQKLQYSLNLSFIGSLLSASIITTYVYFNESKVDDHLFIVSFMVTLIILSFCLLVVEVVFYFKLKKYTFKITLKNNGNEWEIIRVTNRKELLLKQGKEYKFIKDYQNLPIIIKEKSDKKLELIEEASSLLRKVSSSIEDEQIKKEIVDYEKRIKDLLKKKAKVKGV